MSKIVKLQGTHETTKTTKYKSPTNTNNSNNSNLSDYQRLNTSELSPEQKYAYQQFVQGENLFITGAGGTGKTRLVQHLLEHAKQTNKHIPVCAMTGCAAILLNCNARTLHSWSGIKLAKGTKNAVVNAVLKNKYIVKSWKKAKGLILDEVSMLSRKVFEIVEEIARVTRLSALPFGGLQVVFTGDFFQLPPVGTAGEPETEQFCFESPVWKQVFKMKNHIELKTMFRQKDPVYIEILRQIRKGELSEENIHLLQGYVNREYDPANHNHCIPTKLFPIRSKVDYVNSMMFSKLTSKEYVFEIEPKKDCTTQLESGKLLPFEVLQKCREFTTKEIDYELDQLVLNSPCPQVLRLKKGAAVMCNINMDMDNDICNGSQGVIMDIIENPMNPSLPPAIVVLFSNGITKSILPHFWQSEDIPTLAISQYPLCLAWALTIHKIQGATLKMAEMDIGQSIFEYGQTYVALSRIQSLDGLYLSAFQAQRIKTNPKVIEFYQEMDRFYQVCPPIILNEKEPELELDQPENPFQQFALKEGIAADENTEEKTEKKEDEECSICFEPMLNTNISVTSCGHRFHTSCIVNCGTDCICPLCRESVTNASDTTNVRKIRF